MNGNWSPKISPENFRTLKDGLAPIADDVMHVTGCNSPSCRALSLTDVDVALGEAEVIIVCLGLGTEEEKEGSDRRTLALPGKQLDLLKHIVQKG